MYCRKCGNKLGDADEFCQVCGAPTGYREPIASHTGSSDISEEIIFNPPYENPSHFSENELRFAEEETPDPESKGENLKGFVSEDEIDEALKSDTSDTDEVRIKDKKETGNAGHLKDHEFIWNVHEFTKPVRKTDDIEFNWNMDEFSRQEEKAAEAESFEEELFQEMEDDVRRLREKNIERFFTFSRKNEEFQELLDKEYEKFRIRSRSISGPFTGEAAPESVNEPVLHKTEAKPVMADTESAAAEAEPVEVEATEAEPVEPEAAPDAEPLAAVTAPAGEETAPEPDMEEAAEEAPQDPEREAEAPAEGDAESFSRLLNFSQEEYDRKGELESRIAEAFAVVEEEDKDKHKRSVWPILLTAIAVVLAIEIAILGIRYFAPDSAAADAVNTAQTKIVQTVSGWTDGIKELFSGKDSDKGTIAPDDGDQQSGVVGKDGLEPGEEGTGAELPDPNPTADKNTLVSSQLGNNANIQQVKANDTLVWQQGKNYGIPDLNNSKPIENNVWQTPENAEPVYFDQSVVGTIIAFDSQWIDYVNGGNKNVLNLVKKDSEAYRKTANFSKIGKIKETFKLLEIGEIRQGAHGFYVWAHEEIQVTENGKSTDKKYNWIYYLEPEEGNMKVINYFRF